MSMSLEGRCKGAVGENEARAKKKTSLSTRPISMPRSRDGFCAHLCDQEPSSSSLLLAPPVWRWGGDLDASECRSSSSRSSSSSASELGSPLLIPAGPSSGSRGPKAGEEEGAVGI